VSTVDVRQHDVAGREHLIEPTDPCARKAATAADRPSRFDRAGDDVVQCATKTPLRTPPVTWLRTMPIAARQLGDASDYIVRQLPLYKRVSADLVRFPATSIGRYLTQQRSYAPTR
jgi:hypothetical protein